MARLALYTFGILRGPRGDAQVQGFFDRIQATFASAEGTPGFVARVSNRPQHLGPRFWSPDSGVPAPQTLSVWESMEAVFGFAYRSDEHGEAMRMRREWFVSPTAWPTYVAWWVADGHLPTWEEAIERLEHLHDEGPSPRAFTFKVPFGPAGEPATLDRRAAGTAAPAVGAARG